MNQEIREYRQHLVLAEQKAQGDYDKTVVSLSGGALGISFAFIDKVIGSKPMVCPAILFLAWLCWGTSVTAALSSYYMSHLALRRAIAQVDAGKIETERPGGIFAVITLILNASSGLLFMAGLMLLIFFVAFNLGVNHANRN